MHILRKALKLAVNLDKLNLKSITKLKPTTRTSAYAYYSNYPVHNCKMSTNNLKVLEGNLDRYNGLTITSDKENIETDEFRTLLKESLAKWIEHKVRAVWFKVYLRQAHWVPVLAENEFKFHHAKNDFVMMYRWLPKDEVDNVPCYAHTNVGVGGLVVNDKKQLLVVSEKYYGQHRWKLPGGFVDPGEDLVEAVMREVMEETNIKTEFTSLLALGHSHGRQFGCSDFYIIINLKPLSTEITKCEREIMDARWVDVEEFLNNPNILGLNKFFLKKYLENTADAIKVDSLKGVHEALKIPYTIFHATKQ